MKCCVPQFEYISFGWFFFLLSYCPVARLTLKITFSPYVWFMRVFWLDCPVELQIAQHIILPYFSFVRRDCWLLFCLSAYFQCCLFSTFVGNLAGNILVRHASCNCGKKELWWNSLFALFSYCCCCCWFFFFRSIFAYSIRHECEQNVHTRACRSINIFLSVSEIGAHNSNDRNSICFIKSVLVWFVVWLIKIM